MRNFGVLTISALLLFAAATASLGAATALLDYPPAARDNTVNHYFGTSVPAPYQWMENMQSPALHRWVDSENALTDGYLAKIPVRPWIDKRLTELWNTPKETAPDQVRGPRLFFRRNAGLQNQSVLYVRDSATAAPRMLIDPNVLSPDGSIALAGYVPSPDGRLLAYALSSGGSDWQTIHVLDVTSGKTLPDEIKWVKFSNIAWTNDDRGFFYSRYPEPAANNAINQEVVDQKLYYHALGASQNADRLIYSRPDLPKWILEGDVSENGRWLFVTLVNGTATQNELYYADLQDPQKPAIGAALKPLFTKNDAEYAVVGVDGSTLYLRTTLDAPRRRIVAATLADPAPAHWRQVV
ncbi:MAG: S9 family peptidase, partial [Rhizomicrobium sp.]